MTMFLQHSIYVSGFYDILYMFPVYMSKMDQHAKPNITVNKQEVHNENCRAQVSSIQ